MNQRYLYFIACFSLLFSISSHAQPLQKLHKYTHQDTLRGSITEERTWWDVLKYDIEVKPDYINKTISGKNIITYSDTGRGVRIIQLDMQEPMRIDSILAENRKLSFTREGNVYHVVVRDPTAKYKIKLGIYSLTVFFSGQPHEAANPPWDGGWIWKKDIKGNPWMSVACQGLGASVWYPCKDHQSDEPDSASLTMIVPDTLMAVSNGRLEQKKELGDGTTSYKWTVKNPINNYNIVPYIGKYSNFNEVYDGEKGKLDVNYWVLNYNIEKAKAHMIPEVHNTLKCLEYWYGPYPFYEDGYKLVEAPCLGMEHQSAIAYGNNYKMGYEGKDWSETGWGLKWDFVIVHETGHEWFGNNITSKDIADMWIHEAFTCYSETLFTEYWYGKKAGNDYVKGIRQNIVNDIPIIGAYGVNQEGSGDMYWKGANMIHAIRQRINNDSLFRSILRGLNETFYHQTVTSAQIEDYISKKSGIDFSKVFDLYLRTTEMPLFD